MPTDSPARIDPVEAYKLRTINKLSIAEIARYYNVHKSSVSERLSRFTKLVHSKVQHDEYQTVKPLLLSTLEEQLLASCADPEVIAKAGLRDRVVSFGIMYDKLRLETGKTTENIGMLSKIIVSSDDDLFRGKTTTSGNALTTDIPLETAQPVESATESAKGK